MNDQEFAHSFYAYAPKFIRDKALGPWMGLSQDDLECGEALDRFNRSLACDRKALDENRYDDVRSFYQIVKRALPRSLNLTREQKQPEASRRILADPKRHITVLLPMAWRGLWSFGHQNSLAAILFNSMAYMALFAAPILAVVQWRFIWIYLSLCPSGISCFMPLSAIFFLVILSFWSRWQWSAWFSWLLIVFKAIPISRSEASFLGALLVCWYYCNWRKSSQGTFFCSQKAIVILF